MTDVSTLVAEVAGRRGLCGVGVAIVRAGETPTFTCHGLADGAGGRPIGPQTVFRIASITKTMTAIGLLQLRDRGLFELDEPVNDYLSGLRVETPAEDSPVTFRHLLTHTAGIGEMPRLLSFFRAASWGSGRPRAEPADLARLYEGALRAEVEPGSKWAYANHGFALIGKLVEDISGVPLADFMNEHLFAPLGMEHTGYRRTDRIGAELARGHHWMFGRLRPARDYDMTILGAGAVLSSLSDMARYGGWLAAGGSDDVLRPATLKEMTSAHHSIGAGPPGMGLAFSLHEYAGHRVFGHDGNMPDFASVVLVAPDDGVAVVVLTNTGTIAGANELAFGVLRHTLDVADPAVMLLAKPVADPPQKWSRLTGSYAPSPGFLTNARTWQMLGGEAQIVVRDRRLWIRALAPLRAVRKGLVLHRTDGSDPSRYAFVYEGVVVPVVFEGYEEGRASCLRIGRPVNVVLHRRPAHRSSALRLRLAAAGALALWGHRRRQRRQARRHVA
jgi:CubicO group peptidase (beta-lactamase class C family)